MSGSNRPRLAILTHFLTPYMSPLYRIFGEHFETRAITSNHQENRRWSQESFDALKGKVEVKSTPGLVMRWNERGADGRIWQDRYLHLNPGYFFELLAYKPDAVHTAEMGFRTLSALMYGALFRVPVWVFWEGNIYTERRISRMKWFLRRYVYSKLAKHWITCGSASTEYLKTLGVHESQIVTTQHVIDDEKFVVEHAPYEYGLPRPVAVCVSQLNGRKGIDRLLWATGKLQEEGYTFSLVIIGDGPERESLQAIAEQEKVSNVEWFQHVPIDRMASMYQGADFMIFPTLSDGWGVVVNEAAQQGLPVIASRFAGASHDMLPAQNVFDPLDDDSFLDAYRRALTGDIAPADEVFDRSAEEIAHLIVDDIKRVLSTPRGTMLQKSR